MSTEGRKGAILISGGALLGQISMILSMPIITRYYSPLELGYLTIYTSVLGLFSTTSALHYELSIPLPHSKRAASELVFISLCVITVLSFLLAIILHGYSDILLSALNAEEIEPIKYYLPIGLFFIGISTIGTYFSIRCQTYKKNAISKTFQSMSQAIIQVLSGYYSLSWTSLISGQIIGTIIGVFIIFNNNAIKYLKLNKRFLARTFSLLRKYKNFPLIAAPSSLIVAASNNCPPLLLGLFFSADTAGLYGLGFRVLQVPLRFIGQSISQVFLGQSAIAKRQGGLHDLALKVFCTLSVFSLYTFVPLYLISAELFTTIFGNEWLLAGVYTQWLMPWLFFGFISTPLSMLVTVLQVQSQEFIFQVIFLFGMVAALATGAILKNPDLSIMSLGAVGGCLLFMKIIWILNLVGCNTKKTLYFLAREVIFCMAAITPLALYIYYTNHHYLQKLIIAGLWSILLHLINHHYRKCYEF